MRPPATEQKRRERSGIATAGAYVATFGGIAAAWYWVAPLIGMGTVQILFVFAIGSILLLTVVGCWASERGAARCVGVFLVSAGVVCALLFAETCFLQNYLLQYPPARPMFHNQFGEHERCLLPIWWRPRPIVDATGNWCWADFEDNILAIVVMGDSTRGRYSPIRSGMAETQFKAGPDSGEVYVTVPRCTNRLVVILPNATMGAFPLSPGQAESFEEKIASSGSQNMLETARAAIEDGDRNRFDEFVGAFGSRPP